MGSEENSGRSELIDSEMAGQIRLKLGGMVEGIAENVLAKEFSGSINVDRGQVGGPQVPLLGRGDDKETPNWVGCSLCFRGVMIPIFFIGIGITHRMFTMF